MRLAGTPWTQDEIEDTKRRAARDRRDKRSMTRHLRAKMADPIGVLIIDGKPIVNEVKQ